MSTLVAMPQARFFTSKGGSVSLVWDSKFPRKWQARHKDTQLDLAGEILRLSEPYTPKDTGYLISSGGVQTSGASEVTVTWIAWYARFQYLSPRAPGSRTGPLRGPFWFHRMKAVYKKYFVDRAKAVLQGKRPPKRPRVRSR